MTFAGAQPNSAVGITWTADGATENAWFDTDAEGNAVADGLPEGEYTIPALGERKDRTFRVSGPTEVRVGD